MRRLLYLLLLFATVAEGQRVAPRPNIVVILADDMGVVAYGVVPASGGYRPALGECVQYTLCSLESGVV